MQLYVLGPAFGLPSIDPQCIAAVALLRCLGREDWSIIPSHDQTRRLPLLIDTGRSIEGFTNIARHVEQTYSDSCVALDDKQRADANALSIFVSSHGQTLLDISLYVAYENYSHTRSELTKTLPWYANYVTPPRRRNEARARTGHLGISSIDVDDVHEDLSNKPHGLADLGTNSTFEPEVQKRASLLLGGRHTVMGLLRRPEHSAVFKLHALAENFFEPLHEWLAERSSGCFFSDAPTAVDCLAYGYLSLMLYPQLPQSWLADTMQKTAKLAGLVGYIRRLDAHFALQTDAEKLASLFRSRKDGIVGTDPLGLPWEAPPPSSIRQVVGTFTEELALRIPYPTTNVIVVARNPHQEPAWRRHFPLLLGTTVASVILSTIYAFSAGHLVWPRGEPVHIFGRKRMSDYGHLGAALAGVSFLGRQADARRANYP